MTTMSEERVGFEAWLGIKPCGAAHDLAYEAFRAGAAWQRAQGAVVQEVKVTRQLASLAWQLAYDEGDDSGVDFSLRVARHVAQLLAAPAHPAERQEQGEVQRLREALEWYAEKSKQCRKIGADGDDARQALDLDGGFRARDALAASTGQEAASHE